MSINMRRGLLADFDPGKMTAGEWAVSIDPESENQIVWMCFAPGVVKRMGTYEDFKAQIAEISGDIINQFITALTEAQEQLQGDTETYIQGKVDDEWLPELQALVAKAESSASSADASAKAASASEADAEKSASAAKTSEDNAAKSETAAGESAKTASDAADAAELSKSNAAQSAESAAESEASAQDAATRSAASAEESAGSAATAKESQTASKESETKAAASADAALTSEQNAAQSADDAEASKTAAAGSASAAKESETAAGRSADSASASATAAAESETAAEDWSLWSKSYAVGETEKRPQEATDNAKYYYEQAKRISQGLEGALLPMGTIQFEKLATSAKAPGYMYNISDAFVSDDTFADGGGHQYGAGSNVYCTADELWDVLAAVTVTGVKGSAEGAYRQGNVEITKAHIGLSEVPNVSTNNQAPTWTVAAENANIASGEKMSAIMGKIEKWRADLKSVAFSGDYNDLENKPTAMKNPAALKFSGASSVSYDGSTVQTVNIPVSSVNTKTGAVTLTKADVGLGNVENTADSAKSVSHAKTADSATDSTKVAKAGDTMTGDLTLSGATRLVKYASGKRTGNAMALYAGDANGSGIVIGDGGRTIIGGGESAASLRGALTSTDSAEEMHVASDGSVFIHTACDAIANRKTVTINTAGNVSAPGGFTGNLSGKATTADSANSVTWGNVSGKVTYTGSAVGLVPARDTGSTTTKYLREDGKWVVPPDNDTKYILPVAGTSLGGVKSGTDITVDGSGNVSVNNDSHTHQIGNVTGLQTALDGKLGTSGNGQNVTVSYTTSDTTDANASAWTSVTALTSGMKLTDLFARVSQMFKNVRYLYKQVTELNSKTNIDTGVKGLTAYKCGNVVTLSYSGLSGGVVSNHLYTLGTLPSSLRPIQPVSIVSCNINSLVLRGIIRHAISTNGIIQWYSSETFTEVRELGFSITYITAN